MGLSSKIRNSVAASLFAATAACASAGQGAGTGYRPNTISPSSVSSPSATDSSLEHIAGTYAGRDSGSRSSVIPDTNSNISYRLHPGSDHNNSARQGTPYDNIKPNPSIAPWIRVNPLDSSITLYGQNAREYQRMLEHKERRRWTTTNTVLTLTSLLAIGTDWRQSRYMSTHNPSDPNMKFQETNPILGPHPTLGQVNSIFAAVIPAHLLLAYFLDNPGRNIYLFAITAAEAIFAAKNFSVGARVEF